VVVVYQAKKRSKILMIICICLCLITSTIIYLSYLDNSVFISSKHKVFGASYMTMNNEYYEVVNNEIKKQIEANDDTLMTLDPVLDKDKQNEHIYKFIEDKVDAIFLTPIDYKAVIPALKKASEANIPVIVIDNPVYNNEYVSCTIVSDNYDAGVQCALDLVKRKKSGNIVLLEHLSAKSAIDRINGFKDTIKNYPQFKIVDTADCKGQIELAFPITKQMLEDNEDVDVIMALNDPSALGALAAIKEMNKDNILVYGVDGTPDCKSLIASDNNMIASSAQSPITLANIAVENAYKILNNETIQKEITVPITLINKENINEFDIEEWQ
jgi:ribose transport system substrate-binding protein